MKFSDRIGITQARTMVQLSDVDDRLRNKLWNTIHTFIIRPLLNYSPTRDLEETEYYEFFLDLYHNFHGETVDTIPYNGFDAKEQLRVYFFKCKWYDVYNLVQFIAGCSALKKRKTYCNYVNNVLTSEMSGYRLIGEVLVPVSDECEVKEIEHVISNTGTAKLDAAREHILTALNLLSARENPDYRNVIKESISAVEATCKLLTGNDKTTLGMALKQLNDKTPLHKSLADGFSKIYGYTNDADGIRHSLTDEDSLGVEDARFMLVSCSAFINYLIVKGDKAGLIEG